MDDYSKPDGEGRKGSDAWGSDGGGCQRSECSKGSTCRCEEQGNPWNRPDADDRTRSTPYGALGKDPSQTAGWDLSADPCMASGDRQAERRDAVVGNPDGSGPVCTAVIAAGTDTDL